MATAEMKVDARFGEYAGSAHRALAEQLKRNNWREDDYVCLDSLWDAVGRPEGLDPAAWMEIAKPLIRGFDVYLLRTSSACRRNIDREDYSVCHGSMIPGPGYTPSHGGPYVPGPTLALPIVAAVYAEYLDGAPLALMEAQAWHEKHERDEGLCQDCRQETNGFPAEGFGQMPPHGDC